jgi:hypothetical protein
MIARRKRGIIARVRNPKQARMIPAKPLIFLCFRGDIFSSKKTPPVH